MNIDNFSLKELNDIVTASWCIKSFKKLKRTKPHLCKYTIDQEFIRLAIEKLDNNS
jgi:hypothetical protein